MLSILLTQCQISPNDYQQTNVINSSWEKDSALYFHFPITDSTKTHNIGLILRNNNNYPYSNIYFFTKLIDPKGNEYIDTLEYYLAHPNGEWIGTGTTIKEITLVYKEKVALKDTGVYKLLVWQGMREKELKGIKDISLVVNKTN